MTLKSPSRENTSPVLTGHVADPVDNNKDTLWDKSNKFHKLYL